MSDLISKSKVIAAIKDYFKLIIDNTEDDIFCVLDYNKNLCGVIERMPVDYDVDGVVEQLEEEWVDIVTEGDATPIHHWNEALEKSISIVKGAVKE